jgi:type VI secretion system secreted protein Hcp
MSSDCFINMDQVPGEAHDKDFAGAIEVIAWNWGISWRGDLSKNTRKGTADVGHFTFNHHLDSASAGLLHRCALGIPVPKATLTQRRAGGKAAQNFLVIKFKDVRIVQVALASGSAGDYPQEEVAFSFQSVAFEYAPQSGTGANQSGKHTFNWTAGTAE